VNFEKQKSQIEQVFESSVSSSDLYSVSETESSSDESEDLRKRWFSHIMNSHVSLP
jgi:hypothetical protein